MADAKDDYLKGYEEGLKEAFKESLRLIARGYKSREVQIIIKGKLGTLYQRIDGKRRELDTGGEAGRDLEDSLYLKSYGYGRGGQREGGLEEEKGGIRGEARAGGGRGKKEPEKLTPGSYLVKEERAEKSFRIFAELLEDGMDGLGIVRTYPDTIRSKYGLEGIKMIWITKSQGSVGGGVLPSALGLDGGESARVEDEEILPTDLSKLTTRVAKFLRGEGERAVVLEGLEYLMTENRFDTTLKFVAFLKDAIAKRRSYLIIPFDPSTRDKREYNRLKKEIGNEI